MAVVPVPRAGCSLAGLLLCNHSELARPAVDVTQRGVSLAFLLLLVEGGEVPESWTIQQVVERFVRPRSSQARCVLHTCGRAAVRPGVYYTHV